MVRNEKVATLRRGFERALEEAQGSETWLNSALTARVIGGMGSAADTLEPELVRIGELTEQEREIITLVSEGLQNKQVGDRLHIAENTVRCFLAAILEKLSVKTRLELVIYAFRHGLAKPPH